METTLMTYGGGEILYHIFSGIAVLTRKGETIWYLIAIFSLFGVVSAMSKSFFTNSITPLFKGFFVPVFAMTTLLALPTTQVKIEDLIKKENSRTVSGVPLVLVKLTSFFSSLGYALTTTVEKVLHTANDQKYLSTGMIFGSHVYNESRKMKIRNPDLEKNLKNFCQNCVLYDLALKKYTLTELKNSRNLWQFLMDRTSIVRGMKFYPIKTLEKEGIPETNETVNGSFLTCQEAIREMAPFFEGEKAFFAKQEMIKNLPLHIQALTGKKMAADELIGQQLMFSLLEDGLSGSKFAQKRAYAQQRSTYYVLGSLAGTSIVTMRCVFEALIYMSFVFILPFLFLSGGIVFFKNWAWMAMWIQLWPPFYAILDFIMQIVSQSRALNILGTHSDALNFVDQVGLDTFYTDIYALSGYLMISVPFISYAILKGGVASFMHLAGSMMSPVHSAASTAAHEETTGNYSFANVSYGNSTFGAESHQQKNLSPTLTTGFFQMNKGHYSEIHGERFLLDERSPNLREGVISEESISKSLNNSHQKALSFSENSQKAFQNSFSNYQRTSFDCVNSLSQSESYSDGVTTRESHDILESARACQSISKNLGQQLGIDEREAFNFLAQGRIGGDVMKLLPVSGNIDGSMSNAESINKALSSAEYAAANEEFQKNYQKVIDFSKTESHNFLSDENIRKTDSFSKSLDEVMSSSEQFQMSLSDLEQSSQQLSLYENSGGRLTKNLNQDFLDFAVQRFGSRAEASRIVRSSDLPERDSIYRDFFDSLAEKYHNSETVDLNEKFHSSSLDKIDKGSYLSELYDASASMETESGLQRGAVMEKREQIVNEGVLNEEFIEAKITNPQNRIQRNYQNLKKGIKKELSKDPSERIIRGGKNFVNLGMNSMTGMASALYESMPIWTGKEEE